MARCWAAAPAKSLAWPASVRSPAKRSTRGSRSFGTSPSFKAEILKQRWFELTLVLVALAAIGCLATAYVNHSGWTLYYGDAEAHLNIARRIVDSRRPGYDRIGTVWLPLPHLLMLALVRNDGFWHSGLAGA